METKYLFIWEAIIRVVKINNYIDILYKLEKYRLKSGEDDRYFTENIKEKEDVNIKYSYLMGTEYLLRKLLDEENGIYGTSFVGKDWHEVNYRLIIHKLIAKRGELIGHIRSFNFLNPVIYIIRLINLIAYIPVAILKNIVVDISVKNEKILLSVFKFLATCFLTYLIYALLEHYALFEKILNILTK